MKVPEGLIRQVEQAAKAEGIGPREFVADAIRLRLDLHAQRYTLSQRDRLARRARISMRTPSHDADGT